MKKLLIVLLGFFNITMKDKVVLLWLDDMRNPHKDNWYKAFCVTPTKIVWVKTVAQFKDYILNNPMPQGINFDNDLGFEVEGEDGKDAAKWLYNYCLENSILCPKTTSHSSNTLANEYIRGYLKNLREYQLKG